MGDDCLYLQDVILGEVKLKDSDIFIPVHGRYPDAEQYRIYYKPAQDLGSGVEIVVVEWISNDSDSPTWNFENTQVEDICRCSCYFDGLRHLNMGDEGYLNYVNPRHYNRIFFEISILVAKYCRDWRWLE